MSRLTISLAACGYALLLILLPLLRIPFIPLSADFQKGILAAFGLGFFCLVAGGITLFSRRSLVVPLQTFSFIGILLVLPAILSWGFTGFGTVSFWGLGFDMGTVGSFVLFATAITAGSIIPLFQTRLLLHIYVGITVIIGILATGIFLLTGNVSPFSSWPQFSFLAITALLCNAMLFEFGSNSVPVRVLLFCEGILLTIVFLLFFNVPAAVMAVVLFIVFSIVHIVLSESGHVQKSFPLYTSILVVTFVLALVFGLRTPLLSLPPEIRLTLSATELVGGPVYFSGVENALFGSGPNSFSDVWDTYQPVEINTTPLWNTSFAAGYSTAATWAVTLGLFGVLILILYPIIFLIWSYVRLRQISHIVLVKHADVLAASVCIALYIFCAGIIYTITLPLFLLGGLAAGFLLQSLYVQRVEGAASLRSIILVRVPVSIVFFVAGVGILWVSSHQLLAAYTHAHGVAAFEKNDNTTAVASLHQAAAVWSSSQYASDASRVSFELVNRAIASPESNKELIQKHISDAVTFSNKAIEWAPKSYSARLSSASLYVGLTAIDVSGAEAQASTSLNSARILGPTHPEVPYLRAVLAIGLGRKEEGKEYLRQALILKPDYAPALDLRMRLEE